MSLLNLFKLEKLTIKAYQDIDRKRPGSPAKMEVEFNPTTYKRSHSVRYTAEKQQSVNSPGRPAQYIYTPPGTIGFKLVFDGTGVDQIGVGALLSPPSVKKRIETFEKLCLRMNGDIHEPQYLKVCWGELELSVRLKTLEITYTLFDESGDPLRAELDVVFVEDKSAAKLAREVGKNSPDLTHIRVVKAGDTLPLLCREIYGSSQHYLRVARDNALDDFRNLQPGQRLLFRPLPGDAAAAD